ncbi:MAG TPA: peptide deformylase [Gammaproteobacteria bacterium]|jgi:peptide deformylase|nr:peptide deformylase [Pseudomonadota bacterium]MDA8626958.1 peptide deformylase [Pseudomonadales bacterium]MDC3327305.1 peptide deformylase [Pseudomonadales bacterium]HAJ31186.1 peptide deformylase [Gammaproteobacteria bacterium]
MTIRTIIRMGHPSLRTPATPFPEKDINTPRFRDLIRDMRDTLHDAGGIGLAAPQINDMVQVAIIEIDEGPSRYGDLGAVEFSVFVNPRVTVLNPETKGYWEGCLSVPGLRGFVNRPQSIQVDYLDADGCAQQRCFNGFAATVVQHEFDHLIGKLYIDHIADPALLSFEAEFEQFHLSAED